MFSAIRRRKSGKVMSSGVSCVRRVSGSERNGRRGSGEGVDGGGVGCSVCGSRCSVFVFCWEQTWGGTGKRQICKSMRNTTTHPLEAVQKLHVVFDQTEMYVDHLPFVVLTLQVRSVRLGRCDSLLQTQHVVLLPSTNAS